MAARSLRSIRAKVNRECAKTGKFHAENVKKTDRDFPRSADVSLTLTETAGLENFLQDSVVSVCILLWMLVTVLRLTEERRSMSSGMMPMKCPMPQAGSRTRPPLKPNRSAARYIALMTVGDV